MLVHKTNVLRLRNIPLLVICTLFNYGHIFTFKHLCLHSITKILRNGPRAHFPFSLSILVADGVPGPRCVGHAITHYSHVTKKTVAAYQYCVDYGHHGAR
jgi:hypothetical protein